MMFLIIYVGAIAVLFLFVVMMLNIKISEFSENWLRYLPIGGVISIIFLFEIFLILGSDFIPLLELNSSQMFPASCLYLCNLDSAIGDTIQTKRWTALIDSITNIQSLGYLIYTYYFYYFLISSLILLIAMIGAIVLTMHKRQYASKKQLIFKQVSRNWENAIHYADRFPFEEKKF